MHKGAPFLNSNTNNQQSHSY